MNHIYDDKLKNYIEELGEEYKELLFQALLEQSESMETLSVSELIRIDSNVKKSLQQSNNQYSKFWSIGIVYTLFGMFLYLLAGLIKNYDLLGRLTFFDLIEIIAVMLGVAGVFSILYPILRKNSGAKRNKNINKGNDKRKLLEYEAISVWRELEGLCNDYSGKNEPITLRSTIKFLSQEGMIAKESANTLLKLLRIRNNIVHNEAKYITNDELANTLNSSKKIISDIKQKLDQK